MTFTSLPFFTHIVDVGFHKSSDGKNIVQVGAMSQPHALRMN